MTKSSNRSRRLWDTYAFAGFRPKPTVRGVFGNPKVRVVTLVRRSKKLAAGVADDCKQAGMTDEFGKYAICLVETPWCCWNSRFGAFSARVATA